MSSRRKAWNLECNAIIWLFAAKTLDIANGDNFRCMIGAYRDIMTGFIVEQSKVAFFWIYHKVNGCDEVRLP